MADPSRVEWPLAGGPPLNWDYLIWLIDAEMTRRRLGGPAPLRVAFTHQGMLKNEVERSFFANVIRPLPALLGAVEDREPATGQHKGLYTPLDICAYAEAGEAVPQLRASTMARGFVAHWLGGEAPVTITLREAQHCPQRNSNLEAWLKLAGDLQAKGEKVVFVRDTALATEPLPGFTTCHRASLRVDDRMGLYEQAKINLFISNGPAGLALFGDRPYLYFVHIRPDPDYPPSNPGWWEAANGVSEGGQWPWALPTQRMIWKEDTYENLAQAWEQYGAVA